MNKLLKVISIHKKNAFTLIELLVALGLMTLLLGYGIAGYMQFNDKQTVLAAVDEFKGNMQYARSSAINGDLGGCARLLSYRFQTVAVVANPPQYRMIITPVCDINYGPQYGTAKQINFQTGIAATEVDLNIKVLYGSIEAVPQQGIDIDISYGNRTYSFKVSNTGDITDGDWSP